jgi:hypothetical protein
VLVGHLDAGRIEPGDVGGIDAANTASLQELAPAQHRVLFPDAIERFSGGALSFELIGVKLLRAFDANVVIISVDVKQDDGPRRLLGCYLAERDVSRGAVLAVLNATNRVLGNFIATR